MTIELDAQELGKQIHVNVRIKKAHQFSIRLWIALKLIQLAQTITWVHIETTETMEEPWLYYCPNCDKDVNGYKPLLGEDAVFVCGHCNYQFLVQHFTTMPHIVKEDYENDYDEYGCHWAKPYGFVIMAGCPDHD